MVPPEKLIEPAPAAGEYVGAPQPLVVAFGVEATVMAPGATGNVSVKATPERASFWFGLVSVNVSVDVPPGMIGDGENSLSITGGRTAVNVSLAMEPFTVPVSVVDRKPLTFEC